MTCQFPTNAKAIFWFDNATYDDAQPVVTFKNKHKDGIGYLTGEYDIDSNGSLVIRSVNLQHEKMYKVLSFDEDDLYSVFRISVVVTVTPAQQKPIIERCHSNRYCVIQANPGDVLKCSFAGARPPVQLEWYARKNGREESVNSSNYKETQGANLTYETVSEITLPELFGEKLLWLICKSKQAANAGWSYSDVLIEMQSNSVETKSYERDILHFEIKERAILDCTSGLVSVILWKKCHKHQCFFIAFKKETQTTIVEGFEDYFRLEVTGALIISSIQLFHEGNYTCVTSGPRSKNLSKAISLVVLVPPSPSYLIIAECSSEYDCTIPSTGEGTLTCVISRVRPTVTLNWMTEQSQHVAIDAIETTSKEELGLFDISVTMRYKIVNTNDCQQTFKLECRAHGPVTAIFYSRREVRIEQENCILTSSEKRKSPVVVVVSIVLGISLSCLAAYGIWKLRSKRDGSSERQLGTKDEKRPLQVKSDLEYESMKKEIIQRLKLYYEKTFDENCDGSFGLSNYVPNDVSYLNSEKPWNDENLWEPLNSYEDIFSHQKMKNRNVVVEGEVGYGKSTFATYLTMQWCKGNEPNCEILLFISLGHIGTKNLFDFTVSTLLHEEKTLSPIHLENVIRRTENVWIILDDFDAYVNKKFQSSSISELWKERNQKFKIIVLARPYCLLNNGDNPVVRLEPFKDKHVIAFVSKKFAEKEEMQSPFLKAIKTKKDIDSMCHVPLYLNIISSSYLRNGSIPPEVRTLTTFYEFVFHWLLSRTPKTSLSQKNSTETANNNTAFQHNTKISKLAVNGMKTSTNLWDKSKLPAPEEIDKLLKAGILIATAKTERLSDNFDIKQVQHVAFAHQIYQCYYGAHYLALPSKERELERCLSSMDVKNSKYIFIFTCGLCKKDTLFTIIIQELLNKKDYYPYAVNDCLAHCFYERRFLQSDPYRQLLQLMSYSEHRLHFRDGDDRNLLTAKAFVVDACSQLKIPVGILSFTNMVTEIAENYCTLKHDVKFRIPDVVQTFYIIDFEQKLSVKDIMSLLKNMKSVEEIIVYSKTFPRLHDEVEIPEGKEEVKVIWISFEGNDVSTLNYPSINFKLWLNCHATRTVKLLRKQKRWKDVPEDELKRKEKQILEKLDDMDFEKFSEEQSEFSKEEIAKLRLHHETDLSALRGFLKEFHMMYEAKTKDKYDTHRMNVHEHIEKLTSSKKSNIPETSHEAEGTPSKDNKYGQLDELVSGLKNYYQSLHI